MPPSPLRCSRRRWSRSKDRDDSDRRQARLDAWRVVQGTGNCCENYLQTTKGGRLLDFGGSFINYSDDRGQTWKQVRPLTPLANGEGTIVVADRTDDDTVAVSYVAAGALIDSM